MKLQQDLLEIDAFELSEAGCPGQFAIRNYGCQMNAHDADKLANLLYHAGYRQVDDEAEADLLIINTCSIREKAEHQLYSDLGALRKWKRARDGRLLGVGGCVAQQVGDRLLGRFEHLDFVFGTHNLRRVPTMVQSARDGKRTLHIEETDSLDRFDLPPRHRRISFANPGRSYLTVMEGCDMFCSFCIVPRTRGREISRPAESILEEARCLARAGAAELILLGQTVNAYGRHDARRECSHEAGTMPFASLLRKLAVIPGIEALRYTSPHPLFFDEELIAAHADLPELCPHVHLPLQSGSDQILEAMRRRYRVAQYQRIVERLRLARPDIHITTDLIVGFPGETDRDFEQTLSAMREASFVDSYAFKYSPRPGTAAAEMDGQVSGAVAQDRLEQVQALQHTLTTRAHRHRIGEVTRVRLDGESRRGQGQWRGRDPYHRVVNLDLPVGDSRFAVGCSVSARIVDATPHSLIGELLEVDVTSGGISGRKGNPRQNLLPIV